MSLLQWDRLSLEWKVSTSTGTQNNHLTQCIVFQLTIQLLGLYFCRDRRWRYQTCQIEGKKEEHLLVYATKMAEFQLGMVYFADKVQTLAMATQLNYIHDPARVYSYCMNIVDAYLFLSLPVQLAVVTQGLPIMQ